MVLLLSVGSGGQSKLHEMGNALLAAASVWILHAECFSLCILIQSPEAFALLVLGLCRLIIAWCWRFQGGPATATRATVGGEVLLGR